MNGLEPEQRNIQGRNRMTQSKFRIHKIEEEAVAKMHFQQVKYLNGR